ncbi:MAG: DUF2185 domain-containing protein [Bacteroidota bacterium]
MLFSKSKQLKKAVINYFNYVKETIAFMQLDEETALSINTKLKEGSELIEKNKFKLAFEILSTELVEQYIILDRVGIQKVREIIKFSRLNKKWEYDLRRIHSQGYVMGSWRLEDAEPIAKENKYTFYKPSLAITSQLQKGNLVKLTFVFDSDNDEHPRGERMWVKVTEVSTDHFKGELDNHPFYLHELYAGDTIQFEHKHIIDHDLDIHEPNLVDQYINRCFVTSKVLYEYKEVNYLYIDESIEIDEDKHYEDSGWRIFVGDETDEYVNDPENIHFVSLGAVLKRDDSFIHLLEAPIGATYERDENGVFVMVEEK